MRAEALRTSMGPTMPVTRPRAPAAQGLRGTNPGAAGDGLY
ncbi:Hypothetical protein CAP_0857 [Chondromyces apiculatus DSM 436]|uniref:Uncharacterized protein n=1 Tax=Chondromyces apiculatus DSM 436 TaxID=1192034 RepID=A0A017SVR9_9BACT|nr:Hypothetical protein CAP_0857 [Chondromyces apiculatus DSM 436]